MASFYCVGLIGRFDEWPDHAGGSCDGSFMAGDVIGKLQYRAQDGRDWYQHPFSTARKYKDFGDKMGWLSNVDFGYDALHYFVYSRLGKDHRAASSKELIGFSDSILNV